MLLLVGFIMPDPEGWPSVFYHPELKLLFVVYVDDFKMSGPKENVSKGWSLIASKLDMDKPGEVNRYLGCDHIVSWKLGERLWKIWVRAPDEGRLNKSDPGLSQDQVSPPDLPVQHG